MNSLMPQKIHHGIIWARNEYVIHREYATGKGYADLVMIPRRNVAKPALVIELKYNHSAETAIDQSSERTIRKRQRHTLATSFWQASATTRRQSSINVRQKDINVTGTVPHFVTVTMLQCYISQSLSSGSVCSGPTGIHVPSPFLV